MDGAGDQFLTGSAFARDEHGGVEIGDATHELIDALHLRAAANEAIAAGRFFQFLLYGLELLFKRGVLTGAAEHGFEIADRRRAAAIAESAVPYEFKRRRAKAVVRHDDRWDVRSDQLAGKFNTFLERITI